MSTARAPVAVSETAQPMTCSPWCMGWFPEGFDMADVQEANALRAALAGGPCSSLALAVCLSSKG